MAPRTPNLEIIRLRHLRDGGQLRFVILYGLMLWGIPMAVWMSQREEGRFLENLS
jgi:hypothetical protein